MIRLLLVSLGFVVLLTACAFFDSPPPEEEATPETQETQEDQAVQEYKERVLQQEKALAQQEKETEALTPVAADEPLVQEAAIAQSKPQNDWANWARIVYEVSILNAFTSSLYHPFDGPIGFGFGAAIYPKREPNFKDYSGTMSSTSYIAKLDSDVGEEYLIEESGSFNFVLSFNFLDLNLSAMPFRVSLSEYQDKYDSYHILSSNGYYSVPTGRNVKQESMYYSATFPFLEKNEIKYTVGASFNSYDKRAALVLGMRLCSPQLPGCWK